MIHWIDFNYWLLGCCIINDLLLQLDLLSDSIQNLLARVDDYYAFLLRLLVLRIIKSGSRHTLWSTQVESIDRLILRVEGVIVQMIIWNLNFLYCSNWLLTSNGSSRSTAYAIITNENKFLIRLRSFLRLLLKDLIVINYINLITAILLQIRNIRWLLNHKLILLLLMLLRML